MSQLSRRKLGSLKETSSLTSPEIRRFKNNEELISGDEFWINSPEDLEGEELIFHPTFEYQRERWEKDLLPLLNLGEEDLALMSIPSLRRLALKIGYQPVLVPTQDHELLVEFIKAYLEADVDVEYLTDDGYAKYLFLHQQQLFPEEENKCCVCQDENVGEEKKLACSHSVCYSCLSQLYHDRCPLCRQGLESQLVDDDIKSAISARQLQLRYDQRDDDERYVTSLGIN